MNTDIKKTVTDYVIITFGCLLLAIGIDKFYLPHNLVTGGFSGLSIIIVHLLSSTMGIEAPLAIVNFTLNFPLFVIAFFVLGYKVVLRSFYSTMILSFLLFLTSFTPDIPSDLIIASIFGAVFSGLGLGLVFSRQSTTGGTDLVCTIINKFLKHSNISKQLFVIDSGIIVLGLFIFGIEKCMYAIISVYICTKIINTVLEGIGFAKVVYIITDKSAEVSTEILKVLDRGVTGLESVGMYTEKQRLTLMTVIPPKDIPKLKEITKEIDENAFIIISDAREVFGEGFQS